jgi:murein DD-endopeptidase MepM/ murein hydrolase activator NlpD
MNFSSNIRLFLIYIIILIIVTSGVVTVFWTDLVFSSKITKVEKLSNNIFLGDRKLQSNYILYTSNSNLAKYNIKSSCKIISKFVSNEEDKYLFKITYLDECLYWVTYLETSDNLILRGSKLKLNIWSRSKLFDLFVDRNNESLKNIGNNIDKNISKLNWNNISNSFLNLKKNRKMSELKFQKEFLDEIIEFRKTKYIIPVLWNYKLSNNKNKVPNAWRPYRASYTDGIHHGWDIVAPLNTPVVSIDYGKIIRIVNNFKFSDLDKISKWLNLTKETKVKNLDLLRWNQVWLKTSKWDIVLYSHLSSITEGLRVWDMVKNWYVLGKIWISWVPDRNYKKYHLHFPIHKNPYIKKKVWKYTFYDYMTWDWYFKWKSLKYVLEKQKSIFE